MATNVYTRKIGRNRNASRLWLEKEILSSHGFEAGTKFKIVPTDKDGKPGFLIVVDPEEGERKVSGYPGRPIIDISGKMFDAFAPMVQIVAHPGWLLVIPFEYK